MRRTAFLVALIVLPFLAGSLPAQAQSLAELAAKEKRRREEEQKKNGPAKVVTTEDLAKVQAGTATAPSPPLAQDAGKVDIVDKAKAARKAGHNPEGVEDEGPADAPHVEAEDEKTWRQDAQNHRNAIAEAEKKLRDIEQAKVKINGQILLSTDTNEIMRLRGELQSFDEKLAAAGRDLADARQNQAEFEQSARRAGVPPGWIR
jgi:hypothetical protein